MSCFVESPEARTYRASSAFSRLAALVVLAGALALLALPAAALDVPAAPGQWLTDQAGVLSASQAPALNQKLQAFEQSSGTQFIIYTFPTLGDEAIEDFTIRCAEKWKVGQKKYDNGLILFLFIKERKVRIEVGYGLEGSITDAFSSDVIRNDLAPHFQQNDYAGGLNAAADHVIARIEKKEVAVPPLHSGGGTPAQFSPGDLLPLIIIVLIFLFVVGPLLRRSGCGWGGCFPLFPFGGGGFTMGGGGGGFGGGGFSGGGGGFGGGGASGGW
jgi:uncharacterized protein